jgi:periplasmic divalent cation tolerance protein
VLHAIAPPEAVKTNNPFKRYSPGFRFALIWDKAMNCVFSGRIRPMDSILVVLCTCPDETEAGKLAAGLVESRLAACVNVLPHIRSIYRWQGRVHDDAESLMVIKATKRDYPALEKWLTDHHPYDLPEVIAVPVEIGLPAYLEWVAQETE